MKTLLIVRHAKSSWDDSGLTDFERPLNNRGKRDAPFMAKIVVSKGIKADIIYSSPAKRAFTTARIFAEEQNYPEEKIQKEKLIYEYGPRDIIRMINRTDNNLSTVMLFGHNPDLTSLAGHLSDHNFSNVPTCGVVCIDFELDDWDKVGEIKGRLRFFEYPKMYHIKN